MTVNSRNEKYLERIIPILIQRRTTFISLFYWFLYYIKDMLIEEEYKYIKPVNITYKCLSSLIIIGITLLKGISYLSIKIQMNLNSFDHECIIDGRYIFFSPHVFFSDPTSH